MNNKTTYVGYGLFVNQSAVGSWWDEKWLPYSEEYVSKRTIIPNIDTDRLNELTAFLLDNFGLTSFGCKLYFFDAWR